MYADGVNLMDKYTNTVEGTSFLYTSNLEVNSKRTVYVLVSLQGCRKSLFQRELIN